MSSSSSSLLTVVKSLSNASSGADLRRLAHFELIDWLTLRDRSIVASSTRTVVNEHTQIVTMELHDLFQAWGLGAPWLSLLLTRSTSPNGNVVFAGRSVDDSVGMVPQHAEWIAVERFELEYSATDPHAAVVLLRLELCEEQVHLSAAMKPVVHALLASLQRLVKEV